MAKITQKDINGLAKKLDKVELSKNERALLSAIVTMASKVLEVEIPVGVIPSFKEQFAQSFTPGHAEFVVDFAQRHVGGGGADNSIRPSIKP